jgi:aspartyl-tRNA(Asn)/glutamyl-tRNA(Gln) amidotransferase subunit B
MYRPIIGLEIHIELKTKTKMFCSCLNDPFEKHPNINICPVCLAHPGTLPTINKKAVESVLKLGLALNCQISEVSKFDRKNYFYPDLPKGYQISQYDKPLCFGGYLEINSGTPDNQNTKKIRIRRIHLEEDTGRLLHMTDDNNDDKKQLSKVKGQRSIVSLVDFNRAGVPLMELVTEPDIENGEEAVTFAKELQLILRYLGISDADMEKGQMRVEVNISLTNNQQPTTNNQLGTKVEIKNLNSFRAVGEAINYEIKRQREILEKGEVVKQETRGWDDIKKQTVSQRIKEEAHDYRYFPEPDLPPLDLTKFDLEELKISIPELPVQKRKRFIDEYNLSPFQIEILVDERDLAQYFEESVSGLDADLRRQGDGSREKAIQLLYNYLTSDIKGLINEQKIIIKELNITPENLADLIILILKDEISSRLAKDILKEMFLTGLDPKQIIQQKGLVKISDESLIEQVIEEMIKENPKAVEDYKKGKENALQFLIGQAMAKLKGRADPQKLKEVFKNKLK